jgi:hypothetical protein
MRHVSLSDSSRLAALALEEGGKTELLLANLTPAPVEVALDGWAGFDSVAVMDAESWDKFCSAANGWEVARRRYSVASCQLAPYAVASFEGPTV